MSSFLFIFIFTFIFISIQLLFFLLLQSRYQKYILKIDDADFACIGVVFGAGLEKDLSPSPMLIDRLETAGELIQQKKIKKIILSGGIKDMRNETKSMKRYLIDKGIHKNLLLIDDGGVSTIATIQNIRKMNINSGIYLISQRFHLPRALLIADYYNLSATGIQAVIRHYPSLEIMYLYSRETVAIIALLIQMIFINKKRA